MLKQDSYLLLYIKEAIGFAQVRRICRLRAAGAKGIFSFAKENIPFGTPRERKGPCPLTPPLPVCSLKSCGACRIDYLRGGIASLAANGPAKRFASAPTIRCCAAVGGSDALRMRHTPCGCRSAYLVGVRTNFRLPPVSTMRRAKQCRYFARSLPPCYRHSRLTAVRRGCKRSRIAGIHGEVMYTAPTLRSACSHSSYKLSMSGVEGALPSSFLLGV